MLKELTPSERKVFRKLKSPHRIQDYLDELAINFEEKGDTCSSPRVVMQRKSAHCIEAALFAAAVMISHGKKPYLLDLKANDRDYDHVVCLFSQNGRIGAFSKSNHFSLRYREPVYSTVKELVMSYFHEYFNDAGEKTLRSYSRPQSLKKYGIAWITEEEDLWQIANELDEIKHYGIVPPGLRLRKADKFEKLAGNLVEWSPRSGKNVKI